MKTMFQIESSLKYVTYETLQTLNNLTIPVILLLSAFYYYFFNFRGLNSVQKVRLQLEKIVNEYKPEPLCPNYDQGIVIADSNNIVINSTPETNHSVTGNYTIVDGKATIRLKIGSKDCLNLASYNFLNIMGNQQIEANAIKMVTKYGVGSCGPRGFYGTVDVHLDLETRIADFMKMEEAVVYSYGFSTIASAIPAYCKHHDVIFCDEKISFAARRGMVAARSKVIYFTHNNVHDLETKVKQYIDDHPKVNPRERKFLLLEGIYADTGEICDIQSMVKIRSTYKMRLFLDECLSIGVLGDTGRGILEHFNVSSSEVDLVIGSLETLIGSIGGFCVGTHFIIEHQRLSGLGYCFSASLPPLLTHASISGFNYLDENPELFNMIRTRSKEVHNMLKRLSYVRPFGDGQSPIKYLQFVSTNPTATRKHYKSFIKECEDNGLLLGLCPNWKLKEEKDTDCRVRMCINVILSEEDIQFTYRVLSAASAVIMEKLCCREFFP